MVVCGFSPSRLIAGGVERHTGLGFGVGVVGQMGWMEGTVRRRVFGRYLGMREVIRGSSH